jgi:hypothetical protein
MSSLFCACGNALRYDIRRCRSVCDLCEQDRQAGRRSSSARGRTSGRGKTSEGISNGGLIDRAEIAARATSGLPGSRPSRQPSPREPAPMAELIAPLPKSANDGATRQYKLSGLQPGRSSAKPKIAEEEVQRSTLNKLRLAGYRVLQTTVRFKRIFCQCSNCGRQWFQAPSFETGQDPGISDLLVFSERWRHPLLPSTLYLPLEQKGTKWTYSSPEQQQLAEEGHLIVAHSADEGATRVAQVDAFWERVENLECLADIVRVKLAATSDDPSKAGESERETVSFRRQDLERLLQGVPERPVEGFRSGNARRAPVKRRKK